MTNAAKRAMVKLYKTETTLSVDQLPYSADFDRLYRKFREQSGVELTKNGFWRELTNLRKRGDLVRKQIARTDAHRQPQKK